MTKFVTKCSDYKNLKCRGWIEKCILRLKITIWHHEACQVMANCDPKEQTFLFHPHKNGVFFFANSSGSTLFSKGIEFYHMT